MGKIVRKDYLLTAMEIAKLKLFAILQGKDAKLVCNPLRGKTFYRDDNTALYSIALSRL